MGTFDYTPGEADRWVLTKTGQHVLDLLEERGAKEPDAPTQAPQEG